MLLFPPSLVRLLSTVALLLSVTAHVLSAEIERVDPVSPQSTVLESPSSSIWLVSTRCVGSGQSEEALWQNMRIRRRDEQRQWHEATLPEFLASGSSETPTLFYVHGNRFDWNDAIQRGVFAHDQLLDCTGDAAPVRFVIWSWPSDQIRGALRDVRTKAARTNSEAFYLASFLTELDPETPLSLIGFSFGARTITGALHLVGGGTLCGYELDAPVVRSPARVVLGAAALDNHWLFPGHFHGNAITQTDQMLLLYNPGDAVLKRYRFIERRGRPKALGYTGLPRCRGYAELADRIQQINVNPCVGRSHSETTYLCCPSLVREAREYLLWRQAD